MASGSDESDDTSDEVTRVTRADEAPAAGAHVVAKTVVIADDEDEPRGDWDDDAVVLPREATEAVRAVSEKAARSGETATRPALGQRPGKRPRKQRRSRRFRRWLWRGVMLASVLLGLGLSVFAGMIVYYGSDLPETAELADYHPPQLTRIVARDGSLLEELFVERRTLVSIDEVPEVMKHAVLAAEDADFYQHEGLDYLGILRALIVNVRDRSTSQGASTITQQVVKNILLTSERTFERKIRELILARRIEQELTKDEILELYLNHIYFGHGRYGIEEASQYYFGKHVADVTLAEAALMAGLVKAPSNYSPRVDMDKALARQAYVLGQMEAKGFASAGAVAMARDQRIELTEPSEEAAAPEVAMAVRAELEEALGDAARRGGFTVTTSIDPELQRLARQAVRDNLDAYAQRHGLMAPFSQPGGTPSRGMPRADRRYLGVVTKVSVDAIELRVGDGRGSLHAADVARFNPGGLPLSQVAEVGAVLPVRFVGEPTQGNLALSLAPEGAMVVLSVDGSEILALVGGYATARGGFDRATRARRQPGSTFKPLVYSHAIHSRRFTAASLLATDPAAIPGKYRPQNYDHSRGPPCPMRAALAQSINVAAVWLLDQLGPEAVVAWARALGIESPLGADLSLALGAYEVTPLEMAGAYATFANGGTYHRPALVTRIVDADGNPVAMPKREPRRVLAEAEAFVVTSLLREVVVAGTAKRARDLPVEVAGKTGTTNDSRDAWFVGYSGDLVCAVWTGFDDATPLGAGESGGATALPAFVSFMRGAYQSRPRVPLATRPADISVVTIDAQGRAVAAGTAGARPEYFVRGTEP